VVVSVCDPNNAVPPVEAVYQVIELVPVGVPLVKLFIVGLAIAALQNVCGLVTVKAVGISFTKIAPDTALNLLQPLAVLIFT
jgi:hypothetical protein